jgi:hypothetical protein
MATTVTIALLNPIEHHGATLSNLELREPSGALYAQLGEPRILVRNSEGGYYVEQTDVIRKYLDKLIVHQDGAILLSLMSMADVMRVKEELFGFFAVAEAKTIAQRATSSSSA